MKPWEKYGASAPTQASGPWAKYATQAVQQPQSQGLLDTVSKAAGEALTAPVQAVSDFTKTLSDNPAEIQRNYGAALPIAGGIVGGPVGAAVGEFARQAMGTALAPETVPETALGRFGQVVGAGIAQNPAIVPGYQALASGASKVGRGLARIAQSATGTKAEDFRQAARQGVSTYLAPSMDDAQSAFGRAMRKEGVQAKPTLQAALDPQLRVARKTALDAGAKLQAGEAVSSEQILRARQGVDRIIASTPVKDQPTLRALKELRSQFDDALATQSPALKEASSSYRQAIVKRNVTRPLRVNKSGEQSATIPILGSVAGAVTGFGSGDTGTGLQTALGIGAATSPLLWGLGATAGGSLAIPLSNPAIRQVLLEYLAKKNSRD